MMPKRVEERVDDVDDQQEEGGRRQQREDDGPEAAHRPRAVDRGGLDHAARDRLQARRGRTGNCRRSASRSAASTTRSHGVVAVEQRVPVDAEVAQAARHHAERGLEHEQPQHAGDRGRDRVGPDQQRAVDAGAASCLSACVASSSAIESESERDRRRRRRRGADRPIVVGLREQIAIVLEPDELGREPNASCSRNDCHTAWLAGQ